MCNIIQLTIIRNKTCPHTKMNFYKIMAIPVLMFTSKTWMMTGKEKQYLRLTEIHFIRNVMIQGAKLDTFSINNETEERKQQWMEHVYTKYH